MVKLRLQNRWTFPYRPKYARIRTTRLLPLPIPSDFYPNLPQRGQLNNRANGLIYLRRVPLYPFRTHLVPPLNNLKHVAFQIVVLLAAVRLNGKKRRPAAPAQPVVFLVFVYFAPASLARVFVAKPPLHHRVLYPRFRVNPPHLVVFARLIGTRHLQVRVVVLPPPPLFFPLVRARRGNHPPATAIVRRWFFVAPLLRFVASQHLYERQMALVYKPPLPLFAAVVPFGLRHAF